MPLLYTFLFYVLASISYAEENFIVINSNSEEVVSLGFHLDERFSPCSTFKIVLSLMGFDSQILIDDQYPIWEFKKGYDDFLETWKQDQTPQSWMRTSCVWYSRQLANLVGLNAFQNYLAIFDYGNQDVSGGLTNAWLSSSLKISAREQVHFIRKWLKGEFLISDYAVLMTKKLLFLEDMASGWKLFGKTGWSGKANKPELGWFVGWIEKNNEFYPFAYHIREEKINLSQRIPRVKQLLIENNLCID